MNLTGKKFKLWREYGALNSAPVFDAFAESVKKLGGIVDDHQGDIDVIWSVLWAGRMTGNQHVWQTAQALSKPVIVLEVGGIQRGTTWKVALNGINRDAYFGSQGNDSSRAKQLGLKLHPWNNSGDHILICGQHEQSLQWANMPRMSQWVMNVIEQLQQYYDYPIVFRPHPRCRLPAIERQYQNVYRQHPRKIINTYDDYDIDFSRTKFTVNWSSNPGIDSIIQGVPAYVGPSSLAYDVACKKLNMVDNPEMPDRQQWLNDYAWTEFTIDEIRAGLPLNRLTEML